MRYWCLSEGGTFCKKYILLKQGIISFIENLPVSPIFTLFQVTPHCNIRGLIDL